MFAHRSVEVSYETVRAWAAKFGPNIATNIRRRKMPLSRGRHLEMASPIGGERM